MNLGRIVELEMLDDVSWSPDQYRRGVLQAIVKPRPNWIYLDPQPQVCAEVEQFEGDVHSLRHSGQHRSVARQALRWACSSAKAILHHLFEDSKMFPSRLYKNMSRRHYA
jgi:hypothetical protein